MTGKSWRNVSSLFVAKELNFEADISEFQGNWLNLIQLQFKIILFQVSSMLDFVLHNVWTMQIIISTLCLYAPMRRNTIVLVKVLVKVSAVWCCVCDKLCSSRRHYKTKIYNNTICVNHYGSQTVIQPVWLRRIRIRKYVQYAT